VKQQQPQNERNIVVQLISSLIIQLKVIKYYHAQQSSLCAGDHRHEVLFEIMPVTSTAADELATAGDSEDGPGSAVMGKGDGGGGGSGAGGGGSGAGRRMGCLETLDGFACTYDCPPTASSSPLLSPGYRMSLKTFTKMKLTLIAQNAKHYRRTLLLNGEQMLLYLYQ